jgi:DNA replication regulator SLD3
MGSQPVVLIARLDDGRSLYAVEREARGLYVLLHLGSWVDLHQLRAVAVVSKQDVSRTLDRRSGPGATLPAAPLTIPESSKYSKKKRLAIEAIQSMVKRPSMSLSANATPTETRAVIAPEEPAKGSHPQEKLDTSLNLGDAAQPTANEIFENVRTQYFEALYLSKVCLAVESYILVVLYTLTHLGIPGVLRKGPVIESACGIPP